MGHYDGEHVAAHVKIADDPGPLLSVFVPQQVWKSLHEPRALASVMRVKQGRKCQLLSCLGCTVQALCWIQNGLLH
eukprot:6124630-Amphidinium_carterae.1